MEKPNLMTRMSVFENIVKIQDDDGKPLYEVELACDGVLKISASLPNDCNLVMRPATLNSIEVSVSEPKAVRDERRRYARKLRKSHFGY